jgi:hypothetical protein
MGGLSNQQNGEVHLISQVTLAANPTSVSRGRYRAPVSDKSKRNRVGSQANENYMNVILCV